MHETVFMGYNFGQPVLVTLSTDLPESHHSELSDKLMGAIAELVDDYMYHYSQEFQPCKN